MILLEGEISENELYKSIEAKDGDSTARVSFNRYPSGLAKQRFVALSGLKAGDIIWDSLLHDGMVIKSISVSGPPGNAHYNLSSGSVGKNFRDNESSYRERITRLRDPEVLRDLQIQEVQRRYQDLVKGEDRQSRAEPAQSAMKATPTRRKSRVIDRPVEDVRVGDTIYLPPHRGWRKVSRINEVGGFIKLRLDGGLNGEEVFKRRLNSGAQLRVLEWYDESADAEQISTDSALAVAAQSASIQGMLDETQRLLKKMKQEN